MLTGAFKEFGVSKIQAFQGKYIKNMSLAKKHHRTCIVRSYCDLTIYGKVDQKESALYGAKIFLSMGINYSIIRSYYTSNYWQPGALVSCPRTNFLLS